MRRGVFPASITPMLPDGSVDTPGMARLLAWFEHHGCTGAVIGGTNGEGPSLSAVEKRDLLRAMVPVRGNLDLILGIATSSLSEAIWSCRQAAKAGAAAALVMAPGYFREASEAGIEAWFKAVLDDANLPVLVYNFPQRTGVTLSAEMLARLSDHANFAGAKDSSGSEENLASYAKALPGKTLFVGNETLLLKALESGWSGTISGAANVLPNWLSRILQEWPATPDEARTTFQLILRALEAVRKRPQPATHKAYLASIGVIDTPAVRLPLMPVENWPDELRGLAPIR